MVAGRQESEQVLAAILSDVAIDDLMISRPLVTLKKAELQSIHADDDLEIWYQDYCEDRFATLNHPKWKDLYRDFTDFVHDIYPNKKSVKSFKEFRIKFETLGYVVREANNVRNGGRYLELKNIAPPLNLKVAP